MRVVVIGGHLTPALAVIEKLRTKSDVEIFFIGRKFAMEGDKEESTESQTIPKLGIPFYQLSAGRLQRRLTRYTLLSLLKVPIGFYLAWQYLREIRPEVVLSFGGYLALPVVVAAKWQKIPIVTHEQTIVFGLANRIIARLADKIALAWEESTQFFPSNKTVLVGNPIRASLLEVTRRPGKTPLLYFTGGNQGAHIINQTLLEILPELLEMCEVVHQTGSSRNSLDLEKALRVQKQLPTNLASRYLVKKWFETEELVKIFSRATLVIGRSGANIVTELAALGIPAILIPIPWVTQDEQTKNARVLEAGGSALILREAELTGKRLFTTIQLALEKLEELETNAKSFKKIFKTDAASKLSDLVIQVAKEEREKS